MTRQLCGRLCAAWALVFAVPHVFWATGHTAGLATSLQRGSIEAAGAALAPVCAGIALFCVAGAVVALTAAGRPGRDRRSLVWWCRFGAALLVARCLSLLVIFVLPLVGLLPLTAPDRAELLRLGRWYAAVWGPWFVLGAVGWTWLAVLTARASRVNGRTARRRRTATSR